MLDQQMEIPDFAANDLAKEKRAQAETERLSKFVLKAAHERQMKEFADAIASHLQRVERVEQRASLFDEGLTVDGRTVAEIER